MSTILNNSECITEVEDITFPDNATILCPKTVALHGDWKNVTIKNWCINCEHFKGLISKVPKSSDGRVEALPMSKKYLINCAHPIPREINIMETLEWPQ